MGLAGWQSAEECGQGGGQQAGGVVTLSQKGRRARRTSRVCCMRCSMLPYMLTLAQLPSPRSTGATTNLKPSGRRASSSLLLSNSPSASASVVNATSTPAPHSADSHVQGQLQSLVSGITKVTIETISVRGCHHTGLILVQLDRAVLHFPKLVRVKWRRKLFADGVIAASFCFCATKPVGRHC